MKKLVKESLNEWNLFKHNDTEDIPYTKEYQIGKKLVSIFRELGFYGAVGALGEDHVVIECEHGNFMFYIENDNIYYEGIEFTDELEAAEFIGNINNPEELKAELEKILV
jgi:hypothetical protein